MGINFPENSFSQKNMAQEKGKKISSLLWKHDRLKLTYIKSRERGIVPEDWCVC